MGVVSSSVSFLTRYKDKSITAICVWRSPFLYIEHVRILYGLSPNGLVLIIKASLTLTAFQVYSPKELPEISTFSHEYQHQSATPL